MKRTCWGLRGASKISFDLSISWMISSISPVRGSPSGRYMPASPVTRPSQTTWVAPASSASLISATQRYGASSACGSFSPTSAKTVKSAASFSISAAFSSGGIWTVPLDTSTCSIPSSFSQALNSSIRPCAQASSVSVPPSSTGTPRDR